MMTRRKFGLTVLAVGVIVLLVALLLLFNTNSPWALITLGLSILINTFGPVSYTHLCDARSGHPARSC